MKMKRLFFVVLMMVCSVSWAEWELCGSSGSGDKNASYFCDTSTIRRNGAISQMWKITNYTKVQTNARGDRYMSAKVLKAYNCREETNARISLIHYSESMGAGDVVWSNKRQESEWKWNPVTGTEMQTALEIACGRK